MYKRFKIDEEMFNKFKKHVDATCIDFFAVKFNGGRISTDEPVIKEEATLSNPKFSKFYFQSSAVDNLGLLVDINYKNKDIGTSSNSRFCCRELSDLQKLMDAYTLAKVSSMNSIDDLNGKRVQVSLIKDPVSFYKTLIVAGITALP